MKWYIKVAEKDFSCVVYNLGDMYYSYDIEEYNAQKVIMFYRKVIGRVEAQYKYASFIEAGYVHNVSKEEA